jgi:ribosomal protein L37AE/L43A
MKYKVRFSVEGSKDIEAVSSIEAQKKFIQWFDQVTPRTKAKYVFWHAKTDRPTILQVDEPTNCHYCKKPIYKPSRSKRTDWRCATCGGRFRTLTQYGIFLMWISGKMPQTQCGDCDDYEPLGKRFGKCWHTHPQRYKHPRNSCSNFKELSDTAIRKIVKQTPGVE